MTNILCTFDRDGGFVCGDEATGFTAYAYPTSTSARLAQSNCVKVAREMLGSEPTTRPKGHDERRWAILRAAARVQIPAWTDRWMMGDRYGMVVRERVQRMPDGARSKVLVVLLDKSGKTILCLPHECTEAGPVGA